MPIMCPRALRVDTGYRYVRSCSSVTSGELLWAKLDVIPDKDVFFLVINLAVTSVHSFTQSIAVGRKGSAITCQLIIHWPTVLLRSKMGSALSWSTENFGWVNGNGANARDDGKRNDSTTVPMQITFG